MQTTHDLADKLGATHETVLVLVDQIVDDPHLWDETTQQVTDAGAEVISDQVRASRAENES